MLAGQAQRGAKCTAATGTGEMDILETIKDQIDNNSILLYMKGSPNQPQCGFSARTVQALMACGERFAYVDILSNPEIRANLPKYANWPTFPQLWVDGELVGGCDIVTEMFETGELQTLIKETAAVQPQN
jgi:monothiol glutaredoxin